jgi:hypothetical protein
MEEYVSTAITFVANHFDTVEKATSNVVGVGLTYVGIWAGKHACRTLATGTRVAYGKAKSVVFPPVDPVFARLLSHFDDADAMASVESLATELVTGKLVVLIGGDTLRRVTENGVDMLSVLSDAERKTVTKLVKAKVAEVTERDRLARRTALKNV